MTSLSLSLWITAGIATQLAIYLGIGFWRHWQDYTRLRHGPDAASSVSLEEVEPPLNDDEGWSGFRRFRVAQKTIEDDAGLICSLYLDPEDGKPLPGFRPGQFLTIRLDVPGPAGEPAQIVRCYSLSDSPRPERYRISVKRIPAPRGSGHPPGRSSNFLHDHVAVGSIIEARAPSGHFHIDNGDAPVVLIAGGIGITPMMSMLNACIATQPGREVWLFYGVRNQREIAMNRHLSAVTAGHPNVHIQLCFSAPGPAEQAGRDYHYAGRVDVGLFRTVLPLKPYHFYICGPGPMMEALVPALEDWGVPDKRIHFEAFGPASVQRRTQAALPAGAKALEVASDVVVTFARSGKALPWSTGTESLLAFAEANGISVNSGCRAGACGSCQTTIQDGEVAYRQSPDYDPDPGTCLMCVCTPRTSVTLEI